MYLVYHAKIHKAKTLNFTKAGTGLTPPIVYPNKQQYKESMDKF